MYDTPPHTTSKEYLIGRLLQSWRTGSPITLDPNPEQVVRGLGYEAEAYWPRKSKVAAESLGPSERLIVEYLSAAEGLDRTLTGAIEAQRLGKDTGLLNVVLRAQENDPDRYEEGFFTTASAYLWADDEFNIQIPEWAPQQLRDTADAGDITNRSKQSENMGSAEKEKYEVIVATLVEMVASNHGRKYFSGGSVNQKNMAELVEKEIKKQSIVIPGVSKESLRKKFSAASKTKKRFVPG